MVAPVHVLHVDPTAAVRERIAESAAAVEDVAVDGVPTVSAALDADRSGVDCLVTAGSFPDGDAAALVDAVSVPIVVFDATEPVSTAFLSENVVDFVPRTGPDAPARLRDSVLDAVETRRRRTADRQAGSILDSLFEQVPDHIHLYVKDRTGTHVRVTDTLFDADMLLGKTDYEVVGLPPEECDTYQDDLAVIENGERFVERAERSPLYERWLSTWKVPWRQDGDIVGLVGLTQDITERKRYEQRLERTTERFELAADVAGIGVLDWDLNSRAVTFHGAAASVLGLADRDTLSPSALRDHVHPDDEAAVDTLSDPGPDDTEIDIEFRVPGPDGWRWVELTGECRTDDADTPQRIIGVLVDTTDRKERERQLRRRTTALEEQNDRLDEFTSIVSHDLRNPLQVAQGHLELAECDDEHLDQVAAMHERMEQLLDELLALAREGDRVIDLEPVALDTVARESWATVDTDAATLDVRGSATVRADRHSLQQLLENLYRNAVEHSSTSSRTGSDDAVEHSGTTDDGRVTISVGPIDGGFYVADDGPGIAPSIRDRVFERGFSTDDSGTGYGLSIVADIADTHGWSIAVEESADGGARFEITGVDTA